MLQQFSEGGLVAPSVTTTLVCSQQFQKHLGLNNCLPCDISLPFKLCTILLNRLYLRYPGAPFHLLPILS